MQELRSIQCIPECFSLPENARYSMFRNRHPMANRIPTMIMFESEQLSPAFILGHTGSGRSVRFWSRPLSA